MSSCKLIGTDQKTKNVRVFVQRDILWGGSPTWDSCSFLLGVAVFPTSPNLITLKRKVIFSEMLLVA